MARLIAVFGIAGVGKSALILSFLERRPLIRYLSGGDVIRKSRGLSADDRDQLNKLPADQILENQRTLVRDVQVFCDQDDRDVIFDGHNVVQTGSETVVIPEDILSALDPIGIIYISAEPRDIAQRRLADRSRNRLQPNANTLEAEQLLALNAADAFAKAAGIRLRIVSSGDLRCFTSAVDEILEREPRESDPC